MVPTVDVICPPELGDRVADTGWIKHEEWLSRWEKSRMLAGVLGCACHTQGIDFINANEFAVSSPSDPIQSQADTHREFGNAIAAHMKVLATGGGRLGWSCSGWREAGSYQMAWLTRRRSPGTCRRHGSID